MKMRNVMMAGWASMAMLACAEHDVGPHPETEDKGVVARTVALPTDMVVTGVAVEPVTGRRVVLDANRGLYAIDERGSAELIWSVDAIPADVELASALTDVVAMGPGHFALTAINDGYLLELETGRFFQHFCYLPDAMPEENIQPEIQITQAVAYDPATERLYAQPQSFMDPQNLTAPVESLFSSYDLATGTDLSWASFADPNFSAGGMVVERTGVMLMGAGSELFRYTLETGALEPVANLSEHGITHIQGLSIDRASGHLVVVSDGHLVELRRHVLAH